LPRLTTFFIQLPSMPTVAETFQILLSQHCWHGGPFLNNIHSAFNMTEIDKSHLLATAS